MIAKYKQGCLPSELLSLSYRTGYVLIRLLSGAVKTAGLSDSSREVAKTCSVSLQTTGVLVVLVPSPRTEPALCE